MPATILKGTGRSREAIETLGRAAALMPGDPHPWLEIGVLQRVLGDYPASVVVLERARDMDPELFARLTFEPAVLEASREGRGYEG